MNILKLPIAFLLLIISLVLATPVSGQQKRQAPDKIPTKTPAAPAPAPTFDTLLAANSFKFYVEVRGVGQVFRSGSVNELLEPIINFAAPPKEFKSFVKWLNAHADDVMTSRLLFAAWPSLKEVPAVVVAIEFASVEEAAKFEPQLNKFLPTILPPSAPPAPAQPPEATTKPADTAPPKPNHYVKRAGSLVLITPTPLDLKKLRPAGSKLLSQDPHFTVARNRFNSEPIFAFIDVKEIERETEEQLKRYQAEARKAAEERRAREATLKNQAEAPPVVEPPPPAQLPAEAQLTIVGAPTSPSNPLSGALPMLATSLFQGKSDWPDAVGIALSLDNDSFDVRALMINAAGETSDVVPFLPVLAPGPAIEPEAPGIFPASTEMLATFSLDFPQIHARISRKGPLFQSLPAASSDAGSVAFVEAGSPLATIEKQLKINIKDELLPLLGSELAVALPITDLQFMGLPQPRSDAQTKDTAAEPSPAIRGPVIAISLKDKEGMRLLLPKILEGAGIKGVLALAQTERREDTELVSFAGVFAYAYIGDFLLLSTDAGSVRYVVDSYLKHETLSGDSNFKNYTRWQPRQLQGQIYVSPALMASYRTAAETSNLISDEIKPILSRLSAVPQPITYSLSSEGFGGLHELHVPKNLVLMAVAGAASSANPSSTSQNEQRAMIALWMIFRGQEHYKSKKGPGYASLEQLIADQAVPKEMLEASGYKIDMTVGGNGFEVLAVPIEYGKTGKLSFFIDQTGVLRGGDRGGSPAGASDPPIR